MSTVLIQNIKSLLQADQQPVRGSQMQHVPRIDDAWVFIRDGVISSFGKMTEMPADLHPEVIKDASGRIVMPAFCDSHTHLVYAGQIGHGPQLAVHGGPG